MHLLEEKSSVIRSLGEDGRKTLVAGRSHGRARMVAASRRKRMVAHNIADTPSLLAVMVRGRHFFQEDPLIVLLTMGLHVLPSDNVEVKPRFVVTALISGAHAVLSSTDRIRAAQDVLQENSSIVSFVM